MRIPNRYIQPKGSPKAEAVERLKVVEKVVASRDDSEAILAELREIKALLLKSKAVPYIFSMLRNSDGDLDQVVATPRDDGTIV